MKLDGGAMCAQVPTKCTAVPDEILNPAAQWGNKAEFDRTLGHLATLYRVSCLCHPKSKIMSWMRWFGYSFFCCARAGQAFPMLCQNGTVSKKESQIVCCRARHDFECVEFTGQFQ